MLTDGKDRRRRALVVDDEGAIQSAGRGDVVIHAIAAKAPGIVIEVVEAAIVHGPRRG